MTEEEEGSEIVRLAKIATREAFERHKALGHGPTIAVGNELRRIWPDNTYTVIKILNEEHNA